MSALPFEQVMTYAEFALEDEMGYGKPRRDVACPACAWPLRVVDDDARVGHWYLACPCGWHELDGVMARMEVARAVVEAMVS